MRPSFIRCIYLHKHVENSQYLSFLTLLLARVPVTFAA